MDLENKVPGKDVLRRNNQRSSLTPILLICLLLCLPAVGVAGSGTFKGEWWHYYERGLEYAEKDSPEKAISDLKEAIDNRKDDKRRARTYGMHFIEYFPHRELGIIYFNMGDLTGAFKELEESLRNEESAKAIFYLNKTRQAMLQKQKDKTVAKPPVISVESPGPEAVTKDLTVRLKGKVHGEGFVSSVSINKIPYRFDKALEEIKFERELAVDDGDNVITLVAKDLMGNVSEKTLKITVKREGPTIAIFDLLPEERNGTAFVRIKGEVSDTSGISKVLIDGKEVAPVNRAKTFRLDVTIEKKAAQEKSIIGAFDVLGNETTAAVTLPVVDKALTAVAKAGEKAEQERAAKARAEQERLTKEQEAEKERLARQKAEQERLLAEKAADEKLKKERDEAKRLAKEKADAEQAERDRLAKEAIERADRRIKELLAQEQAAKAEKERTAKEKAEAERLAMEKAEQERIAKERAKQAERERIALEKAAAEKLALERAEAERLAKEKAEAERLAQEKAAQDRLAAEQAVAYKEASEKLLTTALSTAPTADKATEQKAVTVVEREKIKQVLDEQQVSEALILDSEKKLKLGRISGGEGTKAYQGHAAIASKAPAETPPSPSVAEKPSEEEDLPDKCRGLLSFDRERPFLNLRDTGDLADVFVDRYPVEGEAFDNCRIDRVVINDREVPVRKGKKIFFSKNVRLNIGKNDMVVDVYDHSGNKTTARFAVTRSLPAFMQTDSRMSILVLPFDPKDGPVDMANIANDYLMGSFVDQKRFTIVDRQKLRQMLDEQQFTQAMIKDLEKQVKLGKLTAAETILATTIKENQKSVEVVSRVINTETSEIMDIKDGYTEDKSPLAVKDLMDALASKIAGSFPVVEGIVIERYSSEVVTDLCNAAKIKKNMGAIIYRKGKDKIHPVTGKSLGCNYVKLGEGRIEDIQEGYSKIRLSDKTRQAEINVRDYIITK